MPVTSSISFALNPCDLHQLLNFIVSPPFLLHSSCIFRYNTTLCSFFLFSICIKLRYVFCAVFSIARYCSKTTFCSILSCKGGVTITYGDRLKELRLSRDLRQHELADILGVSIPTIGTYERCARQPSIEMLQKYSDFFHVSIDYMLCNSDEKLSIEAYRQIDKHELKDLLADHSVTLAGVELSAADKQKIIDIAMVLKGR